MTYKKMVTLARNHLKKNPYNPEMMKEEAFGQSIPRYQKSILPIVGLIDCTGFEIPNR